MIHVVDALWTLPQELNMILGYNLAQDERRIP